MRVASRMSSLVALAFVASLSEPFTATADDAFVYINSAPHNGLGPSAVTMVLAPGAYEVRLIPHPVYGNIAWNNFGTLVPNVQNCTAEGAFCDPGWENTYRISSPSLGNLFVGRYLPEGAVPFLANTQYGAYDSTVAPFDTTVKYSTELDAFQASGVFSFDLVQDESVTLGLDWDTHSVNNWGGLYLMITEVVASNAKPVANAGEDQMLHLGTVVNVSAADSHDPDMNYPLMYAWVLTSPFGSQAFLSDPTVVSPTFEPDVEGDYSVSLVVTDSLGQESDPDSVEINAFNNTPVASVMATPQSVVSPGQVVLLDGSASYDLDGDALTFSWQLQVPPGSVAVLSDETSASPAFVVDHHGVAPYIATLTVSDGWAESEPVAVEVGFSNFAPVADAGDNQSVVVETIVVLDGTGSFDANQDPTTYHWTFSSYPVGSSPALDDPTLPDPKFTPQVPGEYVLSLIVSDGLLESLPDSMTVHAVDFSDAVVDKLRSVIVEINHLGSDAFKNRRMKRVLSRKIITVIRLVEAGKYHRAIKKLQNDVLKKTDGCLLSGVPDKNDWIQDCVGQVQVAMMISEVILVLEGG